MKYEIAAFAVGLLGLAWCAGGCAHNGGPTRDEAAAVVVGLSSAVKIADHVCALSAVEAGSYELAVKCADAYGAARESLLSAALGLDVWSTDRSRSACAVIDAVKHVRELGTGGKDVRQAIGVAEMLAAPLCKR